MSDGKPNLSDLIAQERETMVPSAAARARNLEGLEAALAEGRPPLVDVPPSAVATSSSGGALVGGAIAGVVLVVALWLGLGGDDAPISAASSEEVATAVELPPSDPSAESRAGADDRDSVRSSPSAQDEAEPAQTAATTNPEADPPPVEDTSAEAPSTGSPPSRRKGRARRPSSQSHEPGADTKEDSSFAEELRLLKKAKAAADAGRNGSALRILDGAAKRFGSGFFDEERRALRVRVLCALGRAEAGRAAAQAFFRDYPASPQTERVRHACD